MSEPENLAETIAALIVFMFGSLVIVGGLFVLLHHDDIARVLFGP